MNPKVKKILIIAMTLIIASLALAVPAMATGGGVTPQPSEQYVPDFIKNIGNGVMGIIQIGFFIILGFVSIKFLMEKQYAQFATFLLVGAIIYLFLFQPTVLKTLVDQITKAFGIG